MAPLVFAVRRWEARLLPFVVVVVAMGRHYELVNDIASLENAHMYLFLSSIYLYLYSFISGNIEDHFMF